MPEQVPVRSVRNGGVDHLEVATPGEAHIAALRRERAGYLTQGRTDRAEQVAAELERLGAPADPAPREGDGPLEDTAERTPRQRAVTRRRR
ncbi:hypothetical protein [Microbispora triticiradicis]|uniref:hypothetical protein n=1 Tax=Microbispora triticiradicis TaxID=2200763 RepID=UPI001AD6D1B4|nr:hypothetical protein [Microbispora triticiradicis]MBO4274130.1 hypothetical protein [Microbispora triticiradicis]